ncbi:glycosyltransferase family 2 protein [Sphingomonas hankyongi]|uniref:Glycosyltransferase family 2 protein n=1 Tax=Sphingomonas hankyongi TaxID=2908209 RepID=A0ABT0S3K5_9SPHN|nr:glycosyltransferase family 2 protein [Sphingomonas hankyongi]MCL6730130.1 glycosyltransferase family 2 protein [Sphingomonas hankyongi]
MSVAVVIVNFRTAALVGKCLQALLSERARLPGMCAIIVDGGSNDGSAETLRKFLSQGQFREWTDLITLEVNGGFAFANNVALSSLLARRDPPEFIMLLNPDTVIEPQAVVILADYLRDNPTVAAVGSQLLEPDGTPTGSAFPFPNLRGEMARAARTDLIYRLLRARPPAYPPAQNDFEADWVTGASVMLRTAALRDSGLFDDGFFLYHEEIELMWRMRKSGWQIRHEPRSRVRHVGGAATGVHSRPLPGAKLPPRPAYWYESRRRFFSLTRGRFTAMTAVLSWGIGYAIFSLRRSLRMSRNLQLIEHELRDQLQHSFPWRADPPSPSIRSITTRDHLPMWMTSHD